MFQNCCELDIKSYEAADVYNSFSSAFFAMDYRLGTAKAPWGVSRFVGVELGNIELFLDEGNGVREIIRSRQHIIDNPVSDFALLLPISARASMLQRGQQSLCIPGSFRLATTSLPFYASVSGMDGRDSFSEFHVKIPGPLLREEVPYVDDLCNIPFEIRPGASAAMQSLLSLAFEQRDHLSATDANQLGNTIVKMAQSALIEGAKRGGDLVRHRVSNYDRILEKAKSFIFRNLSNPELDSRMVAEHCDVSDRYLRTIFNAASLQVGAYIRQTRLHKCRAALRDSGLKHWSVFDIAVNWGFVDPSSFCRSFKLEFGKSPREDRASCAWYTTLAN